MYNAHEEEYNLEDIEVVDLVAYLKTSPNLNEKDEKGRTPFFYITNNPNVNLNILRLCFRLDADTNVVDKDGNTPFHNLCFNQDVTIQMLRLCLRTGANLNVKNTAGNTPFIYLCFNQA